MMGASNAGGLAYAGANLTMYGATGNPYNTNWGSWYPGIGNFCIETWAYCTGNGGSGLATVWTLGGTNVSYNADLGLGLLNASPTYGNDNTHYQLVASLLGTSGTWGTIINDGTSDPLNNAFVLVNTWNHLAVTRNSGTLNLWVNGVLSYTTTYSTSITNPSTSSATIGMYGTNVVSRYNVGDAGYNYTGTTRNTRYTVGNAVYTSTFTPPPITAFLPPINGTYFKMEPVVNSGNFSFDPGITSGYTFLNEIKDPTANYAINSNSYSQQGDVSGYGPGIAIYSA
jgi:hypothetical protein